VASSSEAVVDQTCDDSVSHDDTTQSAADSLSNYTPPAYDPTLHLSSSLGHLQLECVPEHRELEEEVGSAAVEVNAGERTSQRLVRESDATDMAAAAAAAAAVSSDDGLQQLGADENVLASVHATADMSAHVESKISVFATAYSDYNNVL